MVQNYNEAVRRGVYVVGKKVFILTVAGALLLQPVWADSTVHAASNSSDSAISTVSKQITKNIVQLQSGMITSGAKMVTYEWSGTRSNKSVKAKVNVIEIDLTNQNVKMDVMTGQNNQFTTTQSVGGMAKETGAVAGTNGDYFSMGTGADRVPMGVEVANNTLMGSPSKLKGMYAFGITQNREPVIDLFGFEGKVTAPDGAFYTLSGVNKAKYTEEPSGAHSHVNAMYLYTSAWKSLSRPTDPSTTPTEVLIENGVVKQISDGSSLPMAVPADGYILRTHGQAAQFIRDHVQIGQALQIDYNLVSGTTQQTVDPNSFQMMIGGHTLLVENGKASAFTRDTSNISGSSAVARTAVGYSKDKKTAYMITVQQNGSSSGMTLKELQNFMVDVGFWKAVNLDGGGSTTLVSRPLGETSTSLAFPTSNGSGSTQRSVVNGLGVFSTAPQGELKGLMVSGQNTLFVGQETNYSLKGYDTYYNPYDTSNLAVNWSSASDAVTWTGQSFKAVKSGTAEVVAKSQNAKTSMKVEVIGGDQINEMKLSNDTGTLEPGASTSTDINVKLKDGRTLSLPASSVKWEFYGFKGSVQGNKVTVNEVNKDAQIGYAVARYDGFSAVMILQSGLTQMWEDFENVSYPIQFTGAPAEVQGSAKVTTGIEGREKSKVLDLQYDMTQAKGKLYAYAELNGTSGKAVDGHPTSMSIDVKGDQSLNWLRAEFVDANNQTAYVDLSKAIDWSDWKTIEVDLSAAKMSYPAKLKRVYVVNVPEGQDERALTGEVAFDNIQFKSPASDGSLLLPAPTVVLQLDNTTAVVNGKNKKIEVAPISKDGTTYVPVKTILDEFGGSAQWDAKAKKVMVLRSTKMIELWVGQKDYIANGVRNTSDVSPLIYKNRTYVPLRLVSEQIGLKVDWDGKNKSITLQ
ncbi:copper amine oxidase [Paenibacillus selenitireducens]|uniref:Copper amine oxidase n=1 Tax=Paenibacillus selenitireducens TaxID=1324314 RepID=A0A1T2X757_9BACL|nr:stalk domain-containing protein [Paenibacillus selenitireducens]OPA75672.1 copper amine oxidase [Paenibacillus selenitireducens]